MRTVFNFGVALLGVELEPVRDAWIAVEDGVIVEVGSRPLEATSHHLDGEFALPGLVDCHVHLALSGGLDIQAEALAVTRENAETMVRKNAALHLANGVTTVRDLGSPGDVVLDLSESGKLEDGDAPRIIAASAIGSATGHGSFIATPAETLEQYIAALDRLASRSVNTVKLFASGGVITAGTEPGSVQMPSNLLSDVVREAHARGMRVAAHAHSAASILNSVEARVDTIEHFSYLDPDAISALNSSASTLVSTLVATERFVSSPDLKHSNRQAAQKIVRHAPHERQALETAVRCGVRIAVGTDAGTTLNPHGAGMQEQAVHLFRAGMDQHSVLRALTRNGAEALAMRAGALAPGMPADVLCLGADALDDVRALSMVERVMLAGQWVP